MSLMVRDFRMTNPDGGRHASRFRRAPRAVAAAIVTALITTTVFVVGAGSAQAAPGDPFPTGAGLVFVSQQDPTRLFKATQEADGTVHFTAEGPVTTGRYNAIAFRESDMFIYAMRQNTDSGSRNLLRIGQSGQVTGLGQVVGMPVGDYNQGTFGEGAFANTMFVRSSIGAGTSTMYLVNPDTVTATTLTLSRVVPNVSDIVFKNGFVWGVYGEGRQMFRINPTTGAVDAYSLAALNLPANPYGAQWVYGNGNIGISNNVTGRVYQISIANPAAATPTFAVVSSIAGPGSSNNDGTAYAGLPADIGVEKTAPATFEPGGAVTYSITVTNHGPGTSSGWSLKDELPAGLTGVTTASPLCTISTALITCSGTPIASGQAVTVTFTGTSSPDETDCVSNTAQVIGNEADPDSTNNSSTATTCPGGAVRSFAVQKSVTPSGHAKPGDTVTYTVTVLNTGTAAFTGVGDDVASFSDDLSGVIDDAALDVASITGGADYAEPTLSWSGPLDVGEQHVVTYAVKVSDAPGDYSLVNAVVPGDDGSCAVLTQCTTTVPVASFHVEKELVSTPPIQSGQTIAYELTVTNVGQFDYTDAEPATLTDDLSEVIDDGIPQGFDASAGTVGYTQPVLSWSGALATADTVTISYSVALFEPIAGDGELKNTVVTPPDANCVEGNDDLDCATATTIEEAPYNLVVTKASPTTFEPGGVVVFTITVTNAGPGIAPGWSLSDSLSADLTDPATTSPGCAVVASMLSCQNDAPMASGDVVVITVTASTSPDEESCISNTATLTPGAGESDPADNEASAETCPGAAVASFIVQKSAEPAVAHAGETVTYTVTVTNTGAVAYTDFEPATFSDDLTAVIDDAELDEASLPAEVSYTEPTLSWAGAVPVGGFVTVVYTVTVPDPLADGGDGLLTNAVAPGPEGTCATDDGCTTETPIASYSVVKAASPTTAFPGGTVTYTITVTNTGQSDFTAQDPASFTDDLSDVLDDAVLDESSIAGGATYAAPVLSWSGALVRGAPVTLGYTVAVNSPATGDQAMANTVVTPPGGGGSCPEGSTVPDCAVTVPIKTYTVEKTAVVDQSDPAAVVVRYAVTVTNTGAADFTDSEPASFTDDLTGVLDDAAYNDDAPPGVIFNTPQLTWEGPVAAGESVTVEYSVTVGDPVTGDHRLRNAVVPNGDSGGSCTAPGECETDTPVRRYTAAKAVNATTAEAGQVLTYTITVTNTGATAYTADLPAVVDDDLTNVIAHADYNDDADHGGVYTEPIIRWELALDVGETVVVSYSVTTRSVDETATLANVITTSADGNCTPTDPGTVVPLAQGPECRTETELVPPTPTPTPTPTVPPDTGGGGIATTGFDTGWPFMAAFALLVLGGALMVRRTTARR